MRDHADQRKQAKPSSPGEGEARAGAPFTLPPGYLQLYAGARKEGEALPDDLRGQMEGSFRTDFSDVRVHQGAEAASVGAMAYTQGNDLHFAPGAYNPSSLSGKELLGHELTHVVQQRAGVVSAPQGKDAGGPAINADPALEAEADRLGAAAARGQTVSVSGAGHGVQPKMASGAVIQCGNTNGGEKKKAAPNPNKEEKEPDPPTEIEKTSAIRSAYDRLQKLALDLIRKQNPTLKLWSDKQILADYDNASDAMALAVLHAGAEHVLSELVLGSFCPSMQAAREALLNECNRRFGRAVSTASSSSNNNNNASGAQQPIAPMSRLMPTMVAPTKEELEEHKKKYNFSMEGGAAEEKQLNLRTAAAAALDELHAVALLSQVAAPQTMPSLDAIVDATMKLYEGPREKGHEIFVKAQAAVRELCEQAQKAGYAIWDPAVQKAIAKAATACAQFSSVGSWIGNRELRR